MSTFHFNLAARDSSTIRPVHLPALPQRVEIWFVSAFLLSSVGVVALNLNWATGVWQGLLFWLTVVIAFRMDKQVTTRAMVPLVATCLIPVWGIAQVMLHTAAYQYATLQASINWVVMPACMVLGISLFQKRIVRDAFLRSLWTFGAIITATELYQLYILGRYSLTPTGLPLLSSNFYAELVELLLPVVLAVALRKGENLVLGCTLTALMAGTTVASGARVGSLLVVLEIAAVLFAVRNKSGYIKMRWGTHVIPFAGLLLFVVGLEGSTNLTNRLQEEHPFTSRSLVAVSTTEMISAHPITGVGMGGFAFAYPKYSHFETSYFINHVHNDYLEMTANGGAVGLSLWLFVLAVSLPAAAKAPWAFGTFAVLLHSFSDFPMYRFPVAALFAILLATAKSREIQHATEFSKIEQDSPSLGR